MSRDPCHSFAGSFQRRAKLLAQPKFSVSQPNPQHLFHFKVFQLHLVSIISHFYQLQAMQFFMPQLQLILYLDQF
jgi:hypothetical protein